MARVRHYYRHSDDEAAQRDLAANGRCRVSEDFDGAGSEFVKAAGDPPLAGYTGFAADGRWRQAGHLVAAGLDDAFGSNDGDLNELKWTQTAAGVTPVQEPTVLRLDVDAGAATWRLQANRWQLRAD